MVFCSVYDKDLRLNIVNVASLADETDIQSIVQRRDGGGLAKKMGPVPERKAHVRLLSECRFQTENSVVRGNTLHHTDGHGPRGIQGVIAQAGTERGLSM